MLRGFRSMGTTDLDPNVPAHSQAPHENPVKRGLVLTPEQWRWSSYRAYALGERGVVPVNEAQKITLRVRKIS